MISPRKLSLVLAALLACGGVTRAAEASRPATPAKPEIGTSADLQKLIDQFNTKRDTILADREALLNQLKNATEEQKKAILEKMQAQQKDLVEAQRALGKQIRDEMRKLRQTSPGPGRR